MDQCSVRKLVVLGVHGARRRTIGLLVWHRVGGRGRSDTISMGFRDRSIPQEASSRVWGGMVGLSCVVRVAKHPNELAVVVVGVAIGRVLGGQVDFGVLPTLRGVCGSPSCR